MKSSRVSRVVQLLTTLSKTSGTKGYTAGELSRMFGVSRRTLFRDLREIQDIGIQPLFSSSRRGYALPPEQFLSPINLNLIDYDSLFDGKAIQCELSPYHLLYNQRAWYVVGLSSVHKAVRAFKLNRIRNAEMSDKPLSNDGSPEFDLAEYIGCAWSMIPEGKMYRVRLRFAPKVANNVAEVRWHNTQKVARNPDGSAAVDFRVDGLGEITWWILSYGDQVEVLSPAELRKTIANIAHKMIEISNTDPGQ
jgi:predicted DNA-binding transcriptional regulator YafY